MDLDSLFKRAFDGFGSDLDPAGFPGVPGSDEATGNGQATEKAFISRCSRFSRSEKRDTGSDDLSAEKSEDFSFSDCAREVPFKSPGNTGTPGNKAKNLAETTPLQFPVKDKEPGTPGTESDVCRSSSLNLNTAAPQRSDWWSGPAMAEIDHLASPAEPLPISPDDVRAGVVREMRSLAEDGREGPGALRDAVEIARAKIRNSEVLAERQAHGGRCHVCDGPLDDSAPVVAVLTGKRGAHLHLHAGCHDAYRARRVALVDRIMRSAGYGPASDEEKR